MESKGSFHVAYAAILLVTVVAGFGPTFFARPLFQAEPLPAVLVAHGLVATGWFLLLLRQVWLVRARRVRDHQRLGRLGWAVIGVLVAFGVPTAFGLVPRSVASGVTDPAMLSSPVRWAQVVRDGLLFVLFAGLALAALAARRQPETHKRLILLASVVLTTPGLARLSILGPFGLLPEPIGFLGLLVLLLVLPVVRDRVADGEVHSALKWGAPATFVAVLVLLIVPDALASAAGG